MSNDQVSLELCNLVSRGMSISEARNFLSEKEVEQTDDSEKGETKLSTAEKKKLIADELEALGYEVPAETVSLAKFKEALDYAKEQTEAEKKTAEML